MDKTPELVVKRLHQLLSARAYLRAALYNIKIGKLYLDSRRDLYVMEDLANVEELLEATIERLDKEIGLMVFGPPEIEPDERVQQIIREVIFGGDGDKKLPAIIKR